MAINKIVRNIKGLSTSNKPDAGRLADTSTYFAEDTAELWVVVSGAWIYKGRPGSETPSSHDVGTAVARGVKSIIEDTAAYDPVTRKHKYRIIYTNGAEDAFYVTDGEQGIPGEDGKDANKVIVERYTDEYVNEHIDEFSFPEGVTIPLAAIYWKHEQGEAELWKLFCDLATVKGDQGIQGEKGEQGDPGKNPQIIDDYWWMWNTATNKYEPTGYSAIGKNGLTGTGITAINNEQTDDGVKLDIIYGENEMTTTVVLTNGNKGDKGDKGDQGDAGEDGVNGKSIANIVFNGSTIEGKVYNVILEDGETAGSFTVTDGAKVELAVIDDIIKWRYTGTDTWTTLISKIDLTGPQGSKGDTGSQGPKGDTGDTGPAGNGIRNIEKGEATASGTKYKINYTDSTSFEFEVKNGSDAEELASLSLARESGVINLVGTTNSGKKIKCNLSEILTPNITAENKILMTYKQSDGTLGMRWEDGNIYTAGHAIDITDGAISVIDSDLNMNLSKVFFDYTGKTTASVGGIDEGVSLYGKSMYEILKLMLFPPKVFSISSYSMSNDCKFSTYEYGIEKKITAGTTKLTASIYTGTTLVTEEDLANATVVLKRNNTQVQSNWSYTFDTNTNKIIFTAGTDITLDYNYQWSLTFTITDTSGNSNKETLYMNFEKYVYYASSPSTTIPTTGLISTGVTEASSFMAQALANNYLYIYAPTKANATVQTSSDGLPWGNVDEFIQRDQVTLTINGKSVNYFAYRSGDTALETNAAQYRIV